MFLLQQPGDIHYCPWKLALIPNALPPQVADHIRDNFPEMEMAITRNKMLNQVNGPQHMDDPIFKQFFETNWNRRDEIHQTACEILGVENPDDSKITRWMYSAVVNGDPQTPVRDWHCDLDSKTLQFILYLGDDSDTITFEAGSEKNAPATLSIPMVHNTLIFWASSKETWHRFFPTETGRRYTVNLTSQLHDTNTNYLGLEEYAT
jgi:hypothetical protein